MFDLPGNSLESDESDWVEVSCFLCGSSSLASLADRGQHGIPTRVAICPECGFVFLSPRWSKERYAKFYAQDYDQYYRPEVFGKEDEDKRYRDGKKILKRLEESGTQTPNTILDVGCGMGWTLEYLANHYGGCATYGIESSAHCVENLEKNLGVNLIATDVDSDWESDFVDVFDLVVMRHVLEHFLSPVRALEKIRETLTSDGVVYIAVPNAMNPKGSLAHSFFRVVHTFYFSPRKLQETAAMAGLQPIQLDEAGHEIWGVFRRAEPCKETISVYDEQMGVLTRCQRRDRLRGLFMHLPTLLLTHRYLAPLKKIFPPGLRSRMRFWMIGR